MDGVVGKYVAGPWCYVDIRDGEDCSRGLHWGGSKDLR